MYIGIIHVGLLFSAVSDVVFIRSWKVLI